MSAKVDSIDIKTDHLPFMQIYILIWKTDSLWQGNYHSPLSYTQDSSGQSDFQDFLDSIVHPSNRWSYRSRRDWTQRGREFSYEDRPTHRSSRSSYTRTSLGPLEVLITELSVIMARSIEKFFEMEIQRKFQQQSDTVGDYSDFIANNKNDLPSPIQPINKQPYAGFFGGIPYQSINGKHTSYNYGVNAGVYAGTYGIANNIGNPFIPFIVSGPPSRSINTGATIDTLTSNADRHTTGNAKQQTTSPGRLPQFKTPITVPKSLPPTTTPKTQPEAVEKIKTFDISQQQNAVFPQVGVGSVVQIPIESTSEVQGKKPIEVR